MKPLAQERASATEAKDTRSHRIDAVVVSSDDALLIELGPILGNRYRTHTVDTPADIGATLQAQRWLGIVDAASLADARGAVARMELQYHRCPLIIISPHPEEWTGAISRGAVAAAIARDEITGPRLTEALVAAELRLRSENSDHSAAGLTSAAGGAVRAGGPKRAAILAGTCAVLIGVLATGVWGLLHKSRAHIVAVTATPDVVGVGGTVSTPAAAPAARPQTVLELLSTARIAFGDQKLLLPRADAEPRGDSALELYTQVLSQEPGNDEALEGVKRLFAAGKARIQSDLASGKFDDASRLVDYFKAAGVNGAALSDIDANINAVKPKWLATRAQQDITTGDLVTADQLIGQLTAVGTSPSAIAELRRALDAKKLETQLTTLAAQVKAAIDSGALLEPANDNARTRLTAMRNLARNQALTVAAQHQLQAALLEHSEQATRLSQFDQAQRYISAATELGSSDDTSEAKRQLQTAMAAASQRAAAAANKAQQAEAVAASAAVRAPPADTGAAADANAPQYIAARPVRALAVTYPDGETSIGYVVVEFTLAPNGMASDLTIVDSKPRGAFDQTAMNAVRAGRYDTRGLVGQRAARARIKLRFSPN